MKSFGLLSGLFGAASLLASSVAAVDVDPIVIKGSHFFYQTNGSEFFMRGVAYQQNVNSNGTISSTDSSYTDPLADAAACARDVPKLVQLQTNIIRVYAVDPTKDHSACMALLASAGIYVVADLSTPSQSINRDNPAWNDDLYYRYTSVVDAFHNYTNVLGFFAGNEVSNLPNNTAASAYVKAAVRDTKAYIKRQNYRTIGVGYATYDGPIRDELSSYFNCGDSASAIDFFGYNIYSWCGNSDYVTSGYQERTNFFANYSVPVFFAEYGCNTEGNRTFSEVQALYGPQMTPVWSGGIVYMYFQEENNYGLVSVSGNTVTPFSDFYALSSQLAMVTPSSTAMSAYTPTNTAQSCPSMGVSWAAVATPLPPTPNKALCSCAASTYSCALSSSSTSNTTGYGDLFGYICGHVPSACSGILSNATSGTYGAYSVCDDSEKLSYVMNAYYNAQPSAARASACNFGGSATVRSATSATGTCSSILAQAGVNGNGSVAAPTGSSGAQAGSSAASSSTHRAGANHAYTASLDLGLLHMGAYVVGAVLTGAGMILL